MRTIATALLIILLTAHAYAGIDPWPSDINSEPEARPYVQTRPQNRPEYEAGNVPAGMRSFDSSGLSMNYPASWTDLNQQLPPIVIFAKFLNTSTGRFNDNIVIGIENVSGYGAGIDEYYAANINSMKQSPGFRILDETKGNLNGVPSRCVMYSVPTQTPAGEETLVQLQIMAISNNRAYVITVSALEETCQKAQNEAAKAIKTIRFH